MSQEKSKTMPMQISFFFFGGGGGLKEGYYGICASSEFLGNGLLLCTRLQNDVEAPSGSEMTNGVIPSLLHPYSFPETCQHLNCLVNHKLTLHKVNGLWFKPSRQLFSRSNFAHVNTNTSLHAKIVSNHQQLPRETWFRYNHTYIRN